MVSGSSNLSGTKLGVKTRFMSFKIGVFFSEEMVNVDSIYKVGPRKTSYVYVGAHISTDRA